MGGGSVLITGGAGYIGGHVALAFLEAGCSVVVLDDLSRGSRNSVPAAASLIVGDAGDRAVVQDAFERHGITAVVHLAGSILVPESVADPLKYYRNNSCTSRALIQACVERDIRHFIFSSTAAVYGAPESMPVSERAPTLPINPYGASKLMVEWMLRDSAAARDFNYVALRYFNVAGADPSGRCGQRAPHATHLVTVACRAALGRRDFVEVFGADYDTPDGTCIRDYIHVSDLAAAHVEALAYLRKNEHSLVLNCGYGHGSSVRQVLEAVEREARVRLDVRAAPRRPGDPASLVADPAALRRLFRWRPEHDDLDLIVRTEIAWQRKVLP